MASMASLKVQQALKAPDINQDMVILDTGIRLSMFSHLNTEVYPLPNPNMFCSATGTSCVHYSGKVELSIPFSIPCAPSTAVRAPSSPWAARSCQARRSQQQDAGQLNKEATLRDLMRKYTTTSSVIPWSHRLSIVLDWCQGPNPGDTGRFVRGC